MERVVRRPAKLAGVVTPPGDKSISHRSLMLNSMAAGEAHVSGLGRGEDVVSTMRCMEKLGATFEETGSPARCASVAWALPSTSLKTSWTLATAAPPCACWVASSLARASSRC